MSDKLEKVFGAASLTAIPKEEVNSDVWFLAALAALYPPFALWLHNLCIFRYLQQLKSSGRNLKQRGVKLQVSRDLIYEVFFGPSWQAASSQANRREELPVVLQDWMVVRQRTKVLRVKRTLMKVQFRWKLMMTSRSRKSANLTRKTPVGKGLCRHHHLLQDHHHHWRNHLVHSRSHHHDHDHDHHIHHEPGW